MVSVRQLHGDLNEPVLGQHPDQSQKTAVHSLAWHKIVGCSRRLRCAWADLSHFFSSHSNRVLKICCAAGGKPKNQASSDTELQWLRLPHRALLQIRAPFLITLCLG